MTVAEQFAEGRIAVAARAALDAGLTLGQGSRRMETAMAQAAVQRYRTKRNAAKALGIHRNTMTRMPIRKQVRRRRLPR